VRVHGSDLYYNDVKLFVKQHDSDDVLDDVSARRAARQQIMSPSERSATAAGGVHDRLHAHQPERFVLPPARCAGHG
jgi:hypothetical protein